MSTMYLNVNECFGPTVQGEGRHQGALASFLRLAGCNLSCHWCDTPYTWDWQHYDRAAETHRWTLGETIKRLYDLPGRIVVSGGEPLLQARALAELIVRYRDTCDAARAFDVETSGTRPLGDTAHLWDTITCSPKVQPSSHQGDRGAMLHESVVNHSGVDYKIVVADEADLAAALRFVERHQLAPHRVWLMPEGTDADTINQRTPWLANAATEHGLNFTSRLHVLAWGDARGH